MKSFELNKENFKEESELYLSNLSIIHIIGEDSASLGDNIHSMEKLINYFNQQYKWDGMFDIDDVWYRNKKGDELFILFYKNHSVGYIWYEKMDKNICKAYNLYVTKIIERPTKSAYWFYNKSSQIMLEKYQKIICDAEEWNHRVHDIFNKTGFKEIL